MTHLRAGDPAPDFNGFDSNGHPIGLSRFEGKRVLLYFYPKDNTPGCTAQACSLRDGHQALRAQGYEVIGVSPDSVQSHARFQAKHSLPFHLVADPDRAIATAYGVYGPKPLYGKTVMGIGRTSFVIGPNGLIERVIARVDTKNHAQQVLEP